VLKHPSVNIAHRLLLLPQLSTKFRSDYLADSPTYGSYSFYVDCLDSLTYGSYSFYVDCLDST